MPLISSPSIRRPRAWDLWSLWLLGLLLIVAGVALWKFWPQVMIHSAGWQRSLNSMIASLIQDVAEHPTRAGWSLLAFSFGYGVLHALGPGHGKIIITTWLATHPERLKNSLSLTFAGSLLQGGVAVVLVTLVLGVLNLPTKILHQSSFWLEKGSYLLVGALGLMLCWRAIRRLVRLLRSPRLTHIMAPHAHGPECGCGHQHMPAPQQANEEGWRARLMIILAMGMRPCSGAILVLLFSQVVGVYAWGVAAALIMAVGTSLTIAGLAILVHFCRTLAIHLGRKRATPGWYQIGNTTLALAGGVVLLIAAIILWLGTQAPMAGGRPF